ncbi:unnamed protein product, partial [marine sediment metagenome]
CRFRYRVVPSGMLAKLPWVKGTEKVPGADMICFDVAQR